jgi:trk system potassium uptake protein TrkH
MANKIDFAKLKLSPPRIIVLSFTGLITIGTLLLLLPWSTVNHNIKGVDAIFTATSATCVTGLIVLDTGKDFTLLGQLTILLLIQLGGLGIMTFSTFFNILLKKRVSFRDKMMLEGVFTPEPWENFWTLLKMILLFTLGIEFIGALFLFSAFYPKLGLIQGIYASVFHSISAFCNAGFSIFNTSMANYSNDAVINTVMPILIVLGGMGFVIIGEIFTYFNKLKKKECFRFSLHTKITIIVMISLILLGAIVFWLLERNHSLKYMGMRRSLFITIFQAITPRTAGFNTIDMRLLSAPCLFFLMILMFIGASPGSTGGGVKTTTLGVLVSLLVSKIRSQKNINVLGRTLGKDIVDRAVAIVIISIFLVVLFTLSLLIVENNNNSHNSFELEKVLFEAFSAYGTVGLSLGITSMLSSLGKGCIIALMFIGRLGPLTLFIAMGWGEPKTFYSYPQENVMLG